MTAGHGRRGIPAGLRTALVALPLSLFAIAGLLAPVLAPADPAANDLAASLLPPSADHLLGTDQLGRDQLSRLLHGAQISLAVTAAVLGISMTVGVVTGTIAGYLGGWADRVVSRIIDIAVALPGMLVALAVIGVRGPGVENLVLAMSVWVWAPYARIARARTASLRGSPHLDALRLLGAGRRASWVGTCFRRPGTVPGVRQHRRRRHRARGRHVEFPRPRHTASSGRVGADAHRGASLPGLGLVARLPARYRDHRCRVRQQPAR